MALSAPVRRCWTCGAKIEFVMGPNDRYIPVQTVRTLYQRAGDRLEKQRGGPILISHFEVCPQASQHSRKKETSA